MKKTIIAATLLASSSTFAAETGYLFFQSDSEAKLNKNTDSSYTLTLAKVPEYVSYFSNRPERVVGMIPLAEFIKLWSDKSIKDNFLTVPPNVAFAMVSASGQAQNFVATVSSPQYQNHQLTYQLKIIGNDKVTTGDMSHIDVFFDDIPWNSGGFGRF